MSETAAAAYSIRAVVDDTAHTLGRLIEVFAKHQATVTQIEIRRIGQQLSVQIEFEFDRGPVDPLLTALQEVDGVSEPQPLPPLARIFGKRVIVLGGGAQVGQVAMGAVSEADRHNLRGERISVDTIPLVGEQPLAEAVRALARLPRVKLAVLAGALMGGEITTAVRDIREHGIPVISLNMAGSVPGAADLVVSDPVQAGVMAVMAVADTAQFDLRRQTKRRY